MAQFVIAVLDGDWACLDVLDDVLTTAGYQTVLWEAGTDPDALIGLSRPDLVILDSWLQERGDGLQLLERLGHDPLTASIPVLICSSEGESLPLRLSPDRRYAILAKPFELAGLLAAVAALLDHGGEVGSKDHAGGHLPDGQEHDGHASTAVFLSSFSH